MQWIMPAGAGLFALAAGVAAFLGGNAYGMHHDPMVTRYLPVGVTQRETHTAVATVGVPYPVAGPVRYISVPGPVVTKTVQVPGPVVTVTVTVPGPAAGPSGGCAAIPGAPCTPSP